MITSVSNQVYVFLFMVVGGMAIALVYDFFRILRKAVKTGSLVTYAEDLLYWLIVAFIAFMAIYYSNDGELRVYLLIGAVIGVVLYTLLFSRIIIGSSLFIIRITAKVLKTVVFLISYPVRLLFRILAVPLRWLAGVMKKSAGRVRSSSRVRLTKITFLKKAFKNKRKNI